MSRTLFIVASIFSVTSLVLVDSAIKGTALLLVAAMATTMLRRDSAAIRHLAWLLAIVAMLAVPLLSALLPQWRVLPEWASIAAVMPVVRTNPYSMTPRVVGAVDASQIAEPDEVESPSLTTHQPAARPDSSTVSRSESVTPEITPASATRNWNWRIALAFVWATGGCILLLRLIVARWILWKVERQGTVIWSAGRLHESQRTAVAKDAAGKLEAGLAGREPLVAAFETACLQLRLNHPVTLLLHPDKTIPVVWGILHSRLLLPVAARQWGGEQVRSVLLHELAHVKRRDTMAQLLAQIACTLYWFHPLAWFAAWRLGVERERACDDLVLASGVRPSAYAGHLLEAVTGLAPARWTKSCGLAMARKSSLEGRLAAVLNASANRRGVSLAIVAIAFTIATGIVVPLAMLRAADERTRAPMQHQLKPEAQADEKSQKPQAGTKLPRDTEAQLDWGEAVNGLRAAVVIHSPDADGQPGIYLVLQNVTDAAIRLCDTMDAERLRSLYVSASDRILFATTSGEATQTDVAIRPGEVAYLPMFLPVRAEGGRSAALIEGLRKDSLQTWRGVLNIATTTDGAWKGKLTTADTRAAIGTEGPQPQTKETRMLYKHWKNHARLNGDIPGGLVSRLRDKVKEFIRNNTGDASGDPYSKKMALLEPRFAVAGDWKPAEVVALLDDIAAVTSIPLETAVDHLAQHTLKYGQLLPGTLAQADWGEPLPGGLRMAFLLEPRAKQYHLGTEVKARILLYNAGNQPVTFITRSFQQPSHKARLASGQDLKLTSTDWTTIGRPSAYRLEPGEYCETNTPGIGIGNRHQDNEDWSNVRAGTWILCEAGTEVTLLPGRAMLTADERPGDPNWWHEFVAERVTREAPVPQDGKEREYLLYRVVRELFGTAPSVNEGEAFGADKSPDALDNLANVLSKKKYLVPCEGPVRAGETKFRVLPPDPDAAKRPRVAKTPGRYNLGDKVRLVVTRRPVGDRVVNEGSVTYYPQGADNISHDLKLPDGDDTWVAVWAPSSTVFWLQQEGMLRKIDFSNPAKVVEVRYESDKAGAAPVPSDIREALRAEPIVPAASKPASRTGAPPATEHPKPASK
jgi:beta-lactamase regulating signal transducer with metallopeptidase domain